MKNKSYRTTQVLYLLQHYNDYPATHFAERWDTTPSKVHALARRAGIRKRAPNGQPVWRAA